jgi:hypothetical protein
VEKLDEPTPEEIKDVCIQLRRRCGKGNDIMLEWKYEMLPLQLKSDSQERTS